MFRRLSRALGALLLIVGHEAIAAPQGFSAWVDAAGPRHRSTLTVQLQAGAADVGRSGQLFVAARRADGQWVALQPQGWLPVQGAVPPYASVTLGSHRIELVRDADLSGLDGTEVYAGCGTSLDDMLTRESYARVYTVGGALAGAPAAGDYLSFSINVQDFSYPELSAAAVQRIVDLHERYRLPVDVYLTDTMLDLYQRQFPALMARLTRSSYVGLNYHLRPPKPYYGTYDWAGLTGQPLATQVATIRQYETHLTDPVTGQPSTADGGYARLLTLPNARPAITAAFTSGEGQLTEATAQAFRELGATWSLSHVGGALNLGESASGLYLRPEHHDLLLFQQTGSGAAAAIEAALQSAHDGSGSRAPFFVGVKMHDNDFFAQTSAWLTVYMDGSRRPPWDTTVKAPLKSAAEQAEQWSLYEGALAYADAQRARLGVAGAAGFAQLRATSAAPLLYVSGTLHIESARLNWPDVDALIAFFRRAVAAGRVGTQGSGMRWSIGADVAWLDGEPRAGEVVRTLAPLGVEFDVHTHDAADRARAADRLRALGATPTGVVSGVLVDELDPLLGMAAAPPGADWRPEALWGLVLSAGHGETPDDTAAGLWRPRSSADWKAHDPAGTLVAVGHAGRTPEAAEALAGRLAEGSHVMPVYSATLNVAPKTLQIVGTTQGIEAIEAWAARVGRLPQVRWATIAATARAWRDAGAMASRINP